jgi:hypothetical protein
MTMQVVHTNAQLAGPVRDGYEQALEFYSKAATGPTLVCGFMAKIGGRT